jgi:EAL domain-containing protein (putative c-di-GMP-specific phosphodiesterase class I)
VIGVEALVRWDHPVRGLVYPDHFLPIAENAGLMDQVTDQVLELALEQVGVWRRSGLDITVAVNLAMANMQDVNFPPRVVDALRRHRLPAEALHLEITESMLMKDTARAYELLTVLRALGIKLAVDDYGTGYSSLAYLHGLPVDDLKLDRTFVGHCDTDTRSAAIVESTVKLAHSLGMRMIAEGVENEAVLRMLTGYGCDLGQGYFIARPQNPDSLTPWLHQQAALGSLR